MLDAIEQVVLAYGAESDRILGVPGEVCFINCAFVYIVFHHKGFCILINGFRMLII